MPNYKKVYWDSSVWIALIKGEVVKGVDRCQIPKMILEDAEEGKVTIFTSRLTTAEVHKKKKYRPLTKEEDDKVQSDFLQHDYIKKVDVDKWVAERANELAWDYNISPNDAIHAASAIKVKAEVLHHWDGDFSRIPVDVMHSEEPTKWEKQTSF